MISMRVVNPYSSDSSSDSEDDNAGKGFCGTADYMNGQTDWNVGCKPLAIGDIEDGEAYGYDSDDKNDLEVEALFSTMREKHDAAKRKTKNVVGSVGLTIENVRKGEYPPLPVGHMWNPIYDAVNDDDFNGIQIEPLDFDVRETRDRGARDDDMPENPDICVILHGINADKKAHKWRVQALNLIKAARAKGYRHFFVPLVKMDNAGDLETITERVLREFRYAMRTPIEGHGKIAHLRRENPTKFRINGRLLLVGVSNGGRVATRIEMATRNEFSDSQVSVVTIASPLAGTSAIKVLPSRLNNKIYGKEFSEEMAHMLKNETLAELARRGKPTNASYWHVMLSEDILVWYRGVPLESRLVSKSNVLTIAQVPHWLAQEDSRVLDFVGKAATFNPLTFPTFSKAGSPIVRYEPDDPNIAQKFPMKSYTFALSIPTPIRKSEVVDIPSRNLYMTQAYDLSVQSAYEQHVANPTASSKEALRKVIDDGIEKYAVDFQ